nr:RhuM family protein [Veillonella sp. VA137]
MSRDGKIYSTDFYNLDAIIAVGYRVNSKEATQFRIWATKAESILGLRQITSKATQVDLYTKASSPYVLLAFRVIGQNELVDYAPTR